MADAKVQIGNSADFLEGTSVDTSAGSNLFREGVVVSDESNGAARARVLNAEPATSDYGLTVRTVGPVRIIDNKTSGTWGYRSGVDGTPTFPANAKVLQISAASPIATSSTAVINGGNTITVPAGQSVTFEPKGNLITPTIVFTGTASYIVEYVV